MPIYTYVNTETGDEWTEIRKIADRLDGVDGKKIILKISAPKQADPTLSTSRGQDFYDKVIAPKKRFFPDLK